MRIESSIKRTFVFFLFAFLLLGTHVSHSPASAGALPAYTITEQLDVPYHNTPRHAIRVVVERGLSREQVGDLIWFVAMTEQAVHGYNMLTVWMHHDQDENMGEFSVAMLGYGPAVLEPRVVFKASYFEPFDEGLVVSRLPLETRREIFKYGGPVEARLAKFGITLDEDVRISAEGYAKDWKLPGN